MLNNYKLNISYLNEGKLYASSNPKTGHYVITINDDDPNKLSFHVDNKVKMEQIKFTLEYDYNFGEDEVAFCNGYQSWTDSREFSRNDVMKSRSWWSVNTNIFHHCDMQGDYNFSLYSKKPGFFHSWSYGYTRINKTVKLFASLRENTGFTIIYYDFNSNKIIIEKDLEGLTLRDNSSYDLMDLFYMEGGYDEVFDAYFNAMNMNTPRIKRKIGYTTWYNYYSNINHDIVSRDLDSISKLDKKIDIFQIDDGFQTAVGDWFSIDKTKFPDGMKAVADEIHSKDMLAGLWLAPFSAQRKSQLAHNHKDWLVKDSKGYPMITGPNWGGFYTLDFYIPDVKEYIKSIFDTVLGEWGFDMVKLDFLYCQCCTPRHGKTRGRIMCDAIDLIRECCGLKLILGCGVPMWPTFGKFDFCRVGADVDLQWKPRNYFQVLSREGVSTPGTICNTIFRRHLNGRAFCNDPDVFILRDNNMTMTIEQRALVAKINKIFGSLLFVSDNVGEYTPEQLAIYNNTVSDDDIEIISAGILNNNVTVEYNENGVYHKVIFDANSGTIKEGNI